AKRSGAEGPDEPISHPGRTNLPAHTFAFQTSPRGTSWLIHIIRVVDATHGRVPFRTGLRYTSAQRGGHIMILVVGATGLVGSEVCRKLAKRGRSVRALVRTTSEPAKVAALKDAGVECVIGDL